MGYRSRLDRNLFVDVDTGQESPSRGSGKRLLTVGEESEEAVQGLDQ